MILNRLFKNNFYICFMPRVKMTPSEYAAKRKISTQAVTKAIRNNYRLPAVTQIEKYGRFYLFTVQVEPNGDLKYDPK